MPERAVIRCKQRPSDYLAKLCVDTMGFWAPHVREAVEVFGVDRVMFGTDYPQEIRQRSVVHDFVKDLKSMGAAGGTILDGNTGLLLGGVGRAA